MNKKEKYINYVVDDLIKGTRINHEEGKIYFPFFYFPSLSSPLLFPFRFPFFSKYVENKYGARDEEIEMVWGIYKERIKELIKQ